MVYKYYRRIIVFSLSLSLHKSLTFFPLPYFVHEVFLRPKVVALAHIYVTYTLE
jgi:hypothetical protein